MFTITPDGMGCFSRGDIEILVDAAIAATESHACFDKDFALVTLNTAMRLADQTIPDDDARVDALREQRNEWLHA